MLRYIQLILIIPGYVSKNALLQRFFKISHSIQGISWDCIVLPTHLAMDDLPGKVREWTKEETYKILI